MNVQEQMKLLPLVRKGSELSPRRVAGRLRDMLEQTARPSRWAARFFAAMVVLTLIARGTSGAAMPKVTLTNPTQGTIMQQADASAQITAGEGEEVLLPEGITVETLFVSVGQTVREGDSLFQLNLKELKDALAKAQATRSQQQAQLAQLKAETSPDNSSVTLAQQSLDRVREDYDRADRESSNAVDQAKTQQSQAQQAYDSAVSRWEELQGQVDPAVTQEMLDSARQAMESAKSALTAAQQGVLDAQSARENALLSASRNLEDAQNALSQADSAYAQAQESAALTAQTNAAQAQEVSLELEETEENIQILNALVKTEGLVTADREGQVLQCNLSEGQPCPQKGGFRLSKEGSQLIAQFTLPQEQAEKVSPGQAVNLIQGQTSLQATVRRVEDSGEETSQVTAVLPQDAVGIKIGSAQATVIFSRTQYNACVPVSAIRQDIQGSYVLTVEESQSAFGIQYKAQRVPVTVLEVDSNGQYAAVEGSISGGVITSSSGTVEPGTFVRYQT